MPRAPLTGTMPNTLPMQLLEDDLEVLRTRACTRKSGLANSGWSMSALCQKRTLGDLPPYCG